MYNITNKYKMDIQKEMQEMAIKMTMKTLEKAIDVYTKNVFNYMKKGGKITFEGMNGEEFSIHTQTDFKKMMMGEFSGERKSDQKPTSGGKALDFPKGITENRIEKARKHLENGLNDGQHINFVSGTVITMYTKKGPLKKNYENYISKGSFCCPHDKQEALDWIHNHLENDEDEDEVEYQIEGVEEKENLFANWSKDMMKTAFAKYKSLSKSKSKKYVLVKPEKLSLWTRSGKNDDKFVWKGRLCSTKANKKYLLELYQHFEKMMDDEEKSDDETVKMESEDESVKSENNDKHYKKLHKMLKLRKDDMYLDVVSAEFVDINDFEEGERKFFKNGLSVESENENALKMYREYKKMQSKWN